MVQVLSTLLASAFASCSGTRCKWAAVPEQTSAILQVEDAIGPVISWFHQKEQFSATAPLPPHPAAMVPPHRPTRRSRSDKASGAGQSGGASPSTRKRGAAAAGRRPWRRRASSSQGAQARECGGREVLNEPPPTPTPPPLQPGTQVLASGGFGRPDSGRLGGHDK